jgi:hypothetical protein
VGRKAVFYARFRHSQMKSKIKGEDVMQIRREFQKILDCTPLVRHEN